MLDVEDERFCEIYIEFEFFFEIEVVSVKFIDLEDERFFEYNDCGFFVKIEEVCVKMLDIKDERFFELDIDDDFFVENVEFVLYGYLYSEMWLIMFEGVVNLKEI